jgi:hypothetical protein
MMRRTVRIGLVLALAIGLAPVAAQANPIVFTLTDGGIDAGFGCTTNAGCIGGSPVSFQYAPPGAGFDAASGTITIDTVAETITVAISIASATFLDTAGAVNGVDEIEFTTVSYSGTLTYTNFSGVFVVDGSTQTVTISGTQEQLLAGGNVVGPAGFVRTANVTAGQCTIVNPGSTVTCGFDFGPGPTPGFNLGIGAISPVNRKFIHTFNVVGVPEPGTAGLLLLGFVGMALRQRRST